jgi:hypothetical protein
LYLSDTYPGKVHDKSICDIEELEFKKEVSLFVDLGYVGLTSTKASILIPHKRRKNQQLSDQQKEYNKLVSKVRVKVEHIIGSVKIYRKVKDKYRGRLYSREDKIMLIACGLHNLKIKMKNQIKTNSV